MHQFVTQQARRLASLVALGLVGMWVGHLIVAPNPVNAQAAGPMSATQLRKEIDTFAEVGAKGYLVWQYSGDRGTAQEFGNDKYSFFRNQETGQAICAALKEKATQYPDMFIGVNMWDAGDAKHSQEKVTDHFSYLKNECGVSVVRTFAYSGGTAGVSKTLAAAQAAGIQLILAIGDYSNGGGGVPKGGAPGWYASGYQGEYLSFANQVLNVSSNNPALYGYELANEPHCGGDATLLPSYITWAQRMSTLLQAGSSRVGIGQMASQDNSMCDSVFNGHFAQSNAASSISIASAHYYNSKEKNNALEAARLTPAGKLFYIGEAGWGGDELDPDAYYLYPIPGLKEQDASTILSSLTQQGYEVQCTAPTLPINAAGGGDLISFLNSRGANEFLFSFNNITQSFDFTNVKVPLFRNVDSSRGVLSSIEQYFGYKDLSAGDENLSIQLSAPLYALLSTEQQCIQQAKILDTIKVMCEKLEEPEKCGLYQTIPGTEWTTKSLQEAWADARSKGVSCSDISSGWQTGLSSRIDSQSFQDLKTGLSNTPLYLNQAYRLAFLVIATELKPSSAFNGLFNFLTPGNSQAEPKYEIRVVAFKIPDIGTNKDQGDMKYSDPLQITRDALLTQDGLLRTEVEAAEVRAQLSSNPNSAASLGPSLTCANQAACTDPLVKSLITMIVNSGQQCEVSKEQLEYEPANVINTDGTISSSEGKIFRPDHDLVKELFTEASDQDGDPQQATFEFLSDVKVTRQNGPSGSTKIKTFLIYPVGTELRTVENTLIGKYISLEAIEEWEKNPPEELQKYFKLSGSTAELEAADREEKYLDASKFPGCLANPPSCFSTYTVGIKTDVEDAEPRILGGRLGFVIRTVQRSIYSAESKIGRVLSNCKSLEQYLLGQCSAPPEDGTTIPPTSGYLANDVIDTSDCRAWARIGAGPTDISYDGPACTAAQGPASNVGKPALKFSSELDISNWRNPNDSTPLCGETLYKYVVCTNGLGETEDGLRRQGRAPALIAHRVDDTGKFDPNGNQTACEYVVKQAQNRGVSPRLALAMWGEESGFSAFTVGGDGEDFGVISQPGSRAAGSIQQQVSGFLGTLTNSTYGQYIDFLLAYSGEDRPQTAPQLFCNNREFPARLRTFYNYLAP